MFNNIEIKKIKETIVEMGKIVGVKVDFNTYKYYSDVRKDNNVNYLIPREERKDMMLIMTRINDKLNALIDHLDLKFEEKALLISKKDK